MIFTYSRICRRLLPALFLLLGALPAAALDAGAAKVRLLFPEGTPLGGDAERRGRAALGEHDPLWARCLYLDDGENHVFLVSMDMHHIPRGLRERVVAHAAEITGPENLVLVATHTGNGPGGMESSVARRWSDGRYLPGLVEYVAESVAGAMEIARDGAQRATLGYGVARQQSLSANAHDPAGPIDEQIGVIRVDNADGQAIAILSNFSAMPRLVPPEQRYHFSADYPGAYYSALEALSDPGCVAIFLPGACSGQRAANPENQTGWAAVESVGRLLAARAKEAANKMSFRDIRLETFHREVSLPPAVGHAPRSAVIQALVLDELVLFFLPAMPSVEVVLRLRSELAQLGYSHQFAVGASNDYVTDIVSRDAFFRGAPEGARHRYGPGMADWLYGEAAALLQGAASPGDGAPGDGAPGADGDATMGEAGIPLNLAGSGFDRGDQRGRRFAHEIRTRYEEAVVAKLREGVLVPPGGAWHLWPGALDPTPVALPALAAAARPWLKGMDGDLAGELEGAARGSGLPFDALWLLQNARAMESDGSTSGRYLGHLGTMVAATGTRAGADGVLVGMNVDWPSPDGPSVAIVRPAEGHRFIQFGFDWQIGALGGVNDAGVAAIVLELGLAGTDGSAGMPVDLAVREILQRSATFDAAVARFQSAAQHREGRVLLSGPGGGGWQTAIVSQVSGAAPRTVDDGLLLGIDMARDSAGSETRERYQAVSALLEGERIVSVGEMQRSLGPGEAPEAARRRPWNSDTRLSVVIVPGARALHVALPDGGGGAGPYASYSLERGGANE